MIRMKCPTCARAIGIDEAYVGKLALCPGCHTTFTVPAPAVLLDETAHPLTRPAPAVPLSALPLPPLTPAADPPAHSPGGPLLPDGPIPLAADPVPSLTTGADRGFDDWARSEPRLRPLAPPGELPVSPSPPSLSAESHGFTAAAPAAASVDLLPSEKSGEPELPPAGEEIKDWNFLALDAPSPAPSAPAAPAADDLPLLLDPAPPSGPPPLPAAETETLLPLLEPEPAEEELILLEPAAPLVAEPVREPAAPLMAEPVLEHDGPVHLPARVEAIPLAAEPALAEVPETAVVPLGIVPPEVVTRSYDLLPPPLLAEPVPEPPPEPEPAWGRDENNFDRRRVERDPFHPRKPRRTYGVVSLIPGLDDFYLGLIVLGVFWSLLAALVILSPKTCWVAMVSGFFLWVGATFWLRQCVEEADPIWQWLVFIPLLAAFFALYHRDRALRAFLVSVAGLLISAMGWAAMPRTSSEQPPNPPPFVDVGP
jgi:hypothetical protein